MTTLHRVIGVANLLFLLLLFLLVQMAASLLGGVYLVVAFVLLYLICAIWGVRNAIHYWGGPPKVTVVDHVLLAAGVLNGLILLAGVVLFIYLGEH
ncbi:MAG: hypothetical protein AAF597_18835 [Bacteroidota bacterium]